MKENEEALEEKKTLRLDLFFSSFFLSILSLSLSLPLSLSLSLSLSLPLSLSLSSLSLLRSNAEGAFAWP